MTRSRRASDYALPLVPVALWGTSFVATKLALASIGPWELAAARASIGTACLAALWMRRGDGRDDRREPGDGWRIAGLAVIGVAVQTGVQAVALTVTSAVHAGWLVALIPIFTAILAASTIGERFPPLKLAGVGLGFLGAFAVVTGKDGGASASLPSTRGDLLVLLSAINWAVYTLAGRTIFRRRAALPVTLRLLAVGTAVLVAIAAVVGDPASIPRATTTSLAAVVYLGVFCTGLSFVAWSKALQRFEPGTLTSFQYLQPLISAATASAVLGEPLAPGTAAGGALVLAGVSLVQRASGFRGQLPKRRL